MIESLLKKIDSFRLIDKEFDGNAILKSWYRSSIRNTKKGETLVVSFNPEMTDEELIKFLKEGKPIGDQK